MKKILLSFAVMCVGFVSFSQQDVQLTHFMYDRMSFNPATTGMDEGYCGTFIYRNQWDKVAGAPNSVLVNGQGRLTNFSSGVGFSFLHDAIGFYRNNAFKLNYSYQYRIHGIGVASAGIGLGLLNVGLNPSYITPEIEAGLDPSLVNSLGGLSEFNFDMNFGLFFRGDQGYYAGVSAGHLTSPAFTGLSYTSTLHYYVFGGMDLDNNLIGAFPAQLKLMPSFLLKGEPASLQMDLNIRAMWNDQFYGGLGYRLQDAVAVMVGYQQKIAESETASQHIRIGYAYDITTSALNQYSVGTHEIMLNYCYVPKLVLPRERSVNPRFL